jgi:DNA-binding CsgD family transcriptional regulator
VQPSYYRTMLVGRELEQQELRRLFGAARRGMSGVLVVRGDGGIGKSALLEDVIASEAGVSATRVSGFEAEMELSFAGLQRLLLPWESEQTRLPGPQGAALRSAFGQAAGPPADRFLVGLATLTLLAGAASANGPLTCLIDDAQWLDRESLEVLSFVGRRIYAEGIVLLFGLRDPVDHPFPLDGFPEMQLAGLLHMAAGELLRASAPGPLDSRTVSRIVAETEGNPLAIIELVGELSTEELTVGGLLPEILPLHTRLESHFLRQLHGLPPGAQTLMLIASAESTGDPDLIWRVARQLGVLHEDAVAVEAHGLLALRPHVSFRHPLLRSAVYGGASGVECRKVHAALAEATDSGTDPERKAWHRGLATHLPDESVAAELESSAERERRTGGSAAVAKFLALAAELTPGAQDRARRRLRAAEAALTAGASRHSRALLDEAIPDLQDPLLRAQALRLDGALRAFTVPGEIPMVLLTAARALRSLDAQLARDSLLEALAATLVSAQLTRSTSQLEIAREALAAAPGTDPEESIGDLMLEGFGIRIATGFAEGVPILRHAIEMLSAGDVESAGFERWVVLGSSAAADMWDCDGYREMAGRFERIERDRGNLDALSITLGSRAHCEMWAGRFSLAEAIHTEASSIAVALGADGGIWELLKTELSAWQGRERETREAVALMTGPLVEEVGAGLVVNLARIASVIIDLSQGHYDGALVVAHDLFDDDSVLQGNQVLPEMVEAGVRSGDRSAAEKALARLEERATLSGTPWALGLLARSKALLASDSESEGLYRRAISYLEATYVVTDLARAHLLYGEWLRRQNRRVDARGALRRAHDMFVDMGAEAFAERARIELRATGERARKRTIETSQDLTPQEEQIARLAAGHATNLEIAAQLFISGSTVDYHLRKVFRKLGVTSRWQLAEALSSTRLDLEGSS